jgi:pentatricopeptide repeat protein
MYFDLMRGQYLAGDDSLRPNDKVYRALIESKRNRNDGEGAEMTLNRMYDDYFTHGNIGAIPTRYVFHGVMSAWVNSSHPDAYQRIESIVHRMQQEYQVRKWDCKPTAVTYTILLSCLAKIGTKDSALRAEKVLRHMYDMSTTDESVKPCKFSCTTVMQAWANTVGVHEAPLRAQAIFDDMLRLSAPPRGDVNIRPNSFTYNSLLTTWARSLHADAGERSLSILQEMERQNEMDPNNFAAPNHFHYTAVISALANKGDIHNVENLLQYMLDHEIRPHAGTLNSVLKAYSRSTLPDAVDRAETLLRNMQSKYGVSPNYVSYTTFVLCIQRSRRPDAFRRAKNVVNEMIEKSMSMGWNPNKDSNIRTNDLVLPNIVTFATLIVALKECNDATVDKIKELENIQMRMQQMKVEPNSTVQKDILKIRLWNTTGSSNNATTNNAMDANTI